MSPELRVSLTKSLIAAAVATCAAGLGTMTTAGAAEPKCVGTEPAEVQPCDYPDAACEPCESRGPSLPPNTLLCIWIEYSGTSVRECVSAPRATGHCNGESEIVCATYWNIWYEYEAVDRECDGESSCGTPASGRHCFQASIPGLLDATRVPTERCLGLNPSVFVPTKPPIPIANEDLSHV